MVPREYKTVNDRHRVLAALEQFWDKHPTDDLCKLIDRLRPEGYDKISDSRILREINKHI